MDHTSVASVKNNPRPIDIFLEGSLAFEDMLTELRAEDGRREAARFTFAMAEDGYIPAASARRYLKNVFAKK